ncbi:MAG: hypothetical protein IJZ00_07860 [Lachnospiraceae bacterium]|nr:hypothetical protein [Lachnospiraceae bacterium]
MKYQDNIRNHYFWDSSEMPNIHETKMMIREYWRTAKEDEAYRKARNKADIISGLAIFGGIGCLFAMIYMISCDNTVGALLLFSLFGVCFLINGIVGKKDMISLDSYISGLINGILVFGVSAGLALWIWLNPAEWAQFADAGPRVVKLVYTIFVLMPVVGMISQVLGIFIAKAMCKEECNARCIGLDLKVVKKRKSSLRLLKGTPVFSYRYQGVDYVAVDGWYSQDLANMPKKDHYATVYVNPKKPDIIYYHTDWKERVLPMIGFAIIWVVVLLFIMGGKI